MYAIRSYYGSSRSMPSVIVAGVRTSAVWVVGTATLSTPIGATSRNNFV